MAPPPPKGAASPPTSITDLPSEVIYDILSRLPLRDAVRTAVLSRWWRFHWRSIPSLSFSFFNNNANLDIADAAIVDRSLELHSGAIHSLSLSIELSDVDAADLDYFHGHRQSTVNLSRWLSALSINPHPLRSVTLYFEGFHCLVNSAIFSFINLTHLDLHGCTFPALSPFHHLGFPLLRTLFLDGCRFLDKKGASCLISICPLLERLRYAGESFDISAPNLRHLVYRGWFRGFAIDNAPLLTTATISLSITAVLYPDGDGPYVRGQESNVIRVLGGVARTVKVLELLQYAMHFFGDSEIPKRIPDGGFERLTVLTVAVDFFQLREIHATICLLRSSPGLREVEIRGQHYNPGRCRAMAVEFWQNNDPLELPMLRILRLAHSVMPQGFVLQLMDFIMSGAGDLKRMELTIATGPEDHVDEAESRQLIEHLRASTRAEIVITEAEDTDEEEEEESSTDEE